MLLVLTPHLLWLRTHDFGPVAYARQSSLDADLDTATRWAAALHWVVDQLLNRALPAWLLIAAALYAKRRSAEPRLSRSTATISPKTCDSVRALLLSWGLVPLALMPMVGILSGADLQLHWGTPFLLFSVPAAMELLSARVDWQRVPLRPAVNAFLVIQALLLVLSHVTSSRGPQAFRDPHWRTFDSEALAKLLEEPARQALSGGAICVVSGAGALAGALALQLADRPLVLIDGRFDHSPWVSIDEVKGCGMLELNEGLPLPGDRPVGPQFPQLSWRIVPPEAASTAHARFGVDLGMSVASPSGIDHAPSHDLSQAVAR